MTTRGIEFEQRVGQAGDGVGRARAGGDKHAADLARAGAGIALGGVDRTLLVADEHVLDLVLLENGVVNREYGAARITEQVLDTLILKRADDHLGAGHHLAHYALLRLVF
ncbi:hypothetical protein BTHI11S_04833 [Bosea thiooxidans]